MSKKAYKNTKKPKHLRKFIGTVLGRFLDFKTCKISIDKNIEQTMKTLNEEERNQAVSWINQQGRDQRSEEVIDLYWSLLNSAEFRWNH